MLKQTGLLGRYSWTKIRVPVRISRLVLGDYKSSSWNHNSLLALPAFLAGGPWFSSSLLSSLLSLDEVFLATGPFACNFRFGALVDLLRQIRLTSGEQDLLKPKNTTQPTHKKKTATLAKRRLTWARNYRYPRGKWRWHPAGSIREKREKAG